VGELPFFEPELPGLRTAEKVNLSPQDPSQVFDDPNLVSTAGLVPALNLTEAAGF
jgi:hypothetical protein